MSTTTAPIETAVTVRESTLLEAGIVALESGQYEQCIGHMREEGNIRCAEGVLADVLIAAYPERFGWSDNGESFRLSGLWEQCGTITTYGWEALHPDGIRIADRAAALLGCSDIVEANDALDKTFAEIAAALRQAMREIEEVDMMAGGYGGVVAPPKASPVLTDNS